jgi:hypothetical protein
MCSRAGDIGEEDGRQHTVERGVLLRTHIREKVLALPHQRPLIARPREVITPGQLHVTRALDGVGDVLALPRGLDRVVRAVKHERASSRGSVSRGFPKRPALS